MVTDKPRGPAGRPGCDAGSITTELVLIVPILSFAFISLVMLAGRISDGGISLQTTTQRAARAATLSANETQARLEADRVVTTNLADIGVDCTGGPKTEVTFVDSGGTAVDFGPGAYVRVELSCEVPVADLALLELPGTVTMTRQSLELVDVRRADS